MTLTHRFAVGGGKHVRDFPAGGGPPAQTQKCFGPVVGLLRGNRFGTRSRGLGTWRRP